MGNVFRSVLAAARAILQQKTVTAGTSNVNVTPDSGYDGLSSVTVQPTPSQTKSVTPTRSAQTVSPDSGKLLSSVSVGGIPSEYIIPSGTKSITANGGFDVSSFATANVNVPNPALSGDATPADVKSGKTFYGSTYEKKTGTYVEPTINNITPSNLSPASMTANNNYKPSANGYAISSYSDISPLASSAINLTANALYRPTTNGYAIKEYSACTPTTDGSYHGSGFVNMSQPGWTYSEKPTLHETTLWTNSSPSSDFASATVTLSSDIDNFDYIEVEFKSHKSQSSTQKTLMSVADFKLAKNSGFASQYTPRLAIGGSYNNNATVALRGIAYVSDTQIIFGTCRTLSSSSSIKNDYAIPVRVIGVSWY